KSTDGLPLPELRRLGGILVDRLSLAREARVVFVPDRLLYNVPFSALRTASNHYLVQDETITVCPSATLYVRNRDRDRMLARHGEPSLLAVASPQVPAGFPSLGPLTRARQEAERIAPDYAHHRVVIATDQQQAPLLSLANDYAV